MPLVPCPECGGQVSPAAVSCPHCGYPLRGADAPGVGAPSAAPPPAGAGPTAPPATEEAIWEGAPSLRALAVNAIASGLSAVILCVVVALIYEPVLRAFAGVSSDTERFLVENRAGFNLAVVLFLVTAVGWRVVRLVWRGITLRSHHYRVSNQRLLVESGALAKNITEIDMRTIEDITLEQTAMQRLLGIGEIGIVSSDPGPMGRAKTRLRLLGVRDPRAVRELVRNAAYQATRSQVFMRST